jgi:broad specificity phosphatase PhoE
VTELLLVRHGESEWNRSGRFQGHADPPLTELGRKQAQLLAEELAAWSPRAVYTSDLRRARATAEEVAARAGAPLIALDELREIDVGDWQGLTWAELERRDPAGARRWQDGTHGWENGETYEQLLERVLRALRLIALEHPSGRVVVVTHGGTLRTIAAYVDGVSIAEHRSRIGPMSHCRGIRIDVRDGKPCRID